ncbi:MAG: 3-dehydroquinate dehydratase [Hyphomicrobiaceae bacterium hypho_1]
MPDIKDLCDNKKCIYIINGPNLNMLGKREPKIYGKLTLKDVERDCIQCAGELGFNLAFHQSNNEAHIVRWIQKASEEADGIIINPAAFTHTSISILDALKIFEFPIIEVHISNPHLREPFRHHSYVSKVATGIICGFGTKGYTLALHAMASLVYGQNT